MAELLPLEEAVREFVRDSSLEQLATLVSELRRRGGGYGLAALCIGVGQGIAMVVEANGET